MNDLVLGYRFVILGKIIHTDFLVRLFKEYGFPKPLVITSLDEEYYRDERLLTPHKLYSNIEDLAKNGYCDLYKMKTVNCEEAINLFDKYKINTGISINCRNIIKKEIIDYFETPLFNLHDSYLPNERGGALNTWRILNGIYEVGNTLHHLNEGIDAGDILLQEKTKITKDSPQTIDYLHSETTNCEKILSKFVDMLRLNKPFKPIKQDNDSSFYYPRLFTEINGLINWDWDVLSIERFIRAFSSPYPGAYTYFRNKRICILKCSIEESGNSFHPFVNGKIVTILDNNFARVVAGGKSLIIEEISVDGEAVLPGTFLDVKYNLSSPEDELRNAKNYVPTTLSMNKNEEKYKEKAPSNNSKANALTSKDNLLELFTNLGIKKGDDVMVHSSMKALGPLINGPLDVIDALIESVDINKGTILMPSHSGQLTDPSEWTNPPLPEEQIDVVKNSIEPFNKKTTPVRGRGLIAETFLSYPEVQRSDHPLNSVSALGIKSRLYTTDHDFDEPEGLDSPIGKLYKNKGKVIGIGVSVNSFTVIHLAEYISNLSYLYSNNPNVLYDRKQGVNIFRRIKKYPGSSENFKNILPILREKKLIKEISFRSSLMTCISVQPVIDCILELLKEDPNFLITEKIV